MKSLLLVNLIQIKMKTFLNVAEKPSLAKEVAKHLSGGNY